MPRVIANARTSVIAILLLLASSVKAGTPPYCTCCYTNSIGDIGGFWFYGSAPYIGTQSQTGIQMWLRLNEGTNPTDSLALYAADNPNGPARRVQVVKPLSVTPPIGGTVVAVQHDTFQEADCYYYWLDHGPGGFPMVRDPRKLDVVANSDNPICYTWWSPQFGDRPLLDSPDIVEVSDPGLDNGRTLEIIWDLSDEDALVDWYNIFRAVGTLEEHGDFHWIASLPHGTSTFTDNALSPGFDYVYMVSAAHHAGHAGTGGVNRGIWNDFSEPAAGTPVADFPIVRGLVRPAGTTSLTPMTAATAVGCPQGDRDAIVVEVLLDPDVFGGIAASAVTISQPANASTVFFHQSSPIPADSNLVIVAPSAEFVYGAARTTFTISAFRGCGIDSALVSVQGVPIDYAHLNTKSYDASSTIGVVNLPDFALFSDAYPSSKCNCVYSRLYERCVDYALPDTVVNLPDFAQFWPHYEHEWSGGGLAPQSVLNVSIGTVAIEFEELQALIGEHKLRATISLEGLDPYEVAVLALHNVDPQIEFLRWTEAVDLAGGSTLCAEAMRDGRNELVIGVLAQDGHTLGSVTLGVAEFRVLSEQRLSLDEEDFALITADFLSNQRLSKLAAASLNVRRSVSAIRYENELAQNYPNPFNPTTTLAFSMRNPGNVRLTIYDVAGRRVRELVNERRDRGIYRAVWDGQNDAGETVASGVYFYKLVAGSFSDTKKMIILK